MKRFIVIAILLFTVSLSAQEMRFGVKGGVNLSSLRYDPEPDHDLKLKTGFLVGGIIQYKLKENFALEAQLLYAQQGVKEEFRTPELIGGPNNPPDPSIGPGYQTSEGKINLKYINLPILARYYFTEYLSINAGPQLGYLISAKGEFEQEEYEVKDNYSDLDLGLNAGIGYEFTNGIVLNATYYLGLKDIFAVEDPFIVTEIKQNVIQFSVGYLF